MKKLFTHIELQVLQIYQKLIKVVVKDKECLEVVKEEDGLKVNL